MLSQAPAQRVEKAAHAGPRPPGNARTHPQTPRKETQASKTPWPPRGGVSGGPKAEPRPRAVVPIPCAVRVLPDRAGGGVGAMKRFVGVEEVGPRFFGHFPSHSPAFGRGLPCVCVCVGVLRAGQGAGSELMNMQCSTLPRFLTDRKTSRAALLSLRSFLSPLFLLCSCFCGSHCVGVHLHVCGCVTLGGAWQECV